MASRRNQIADILRQRFLSGLHLGRVGPGDRLPSVRDLARELDVDRRVVLAAYQELEREGLVELRQRSGIFFTTSGDRAAATVSRRDEWVRWAADVMLQGLQRGVPALELPDRLRSHLGTLRLRAACIECNDDQIASLCAELRGDYGLEARGVDVDALLAASTPSQEVDGADLLVTTPFHAGEVKEVAERLGKPWVAASLRSDIFAEIARLLPEGPVYGVVTDPRFAKKLHKIFALTAGAANFRALVVGRDDLGEIAGDAPAYVTRTARERLRDSPLLTRAMPESRMFSPESAREVLTFIIRANVEALDQGGSRRSP